MAAGWVPPAGWVEVQSQLKRSGSVTLNSQGTGVITFDPANARQRYVVTSVVVSTNQLATATVVPVATVAVNTANIAVLSSGNQRGSSSWSGNNDVFTGIIDVGPCDFLTVAWQPPAGATSGQIAVLAGVIASCVIAGSIFTRRG